MTDRDLLELAAKAAGLSLSDGAVWDDERADYVSWNPLTDDGDAFRLAVQLGMLVAIIDHSDLSQVEASAAARTIAVESLGTDSFAAIRRAIARAAAEAGRAMP